MTCNQPTITVGLMIAMYLERLNSDNGKPRSCLLNDSHNDWRVALAILWKKLVFVMGLGIQCCKVSSKELYSV